MSSVIDKSSEQQGPVASAPGELQLQARDATVAPYLVRPVFFILTVLLVLAALTQAGGRILFANLDRLEPRINELLAPQGIKLSEISGHWRFFNPLLKVASGSAPGASFGPSWAEIDTLESLARNRVILRNAAVSDVRLTLSQDEAGEWSLEGRRPTELAFDWQSLLWHSDQLDLRALVRLRGHELPASEMVVNAGITNLGGRHRGDIRIANVAGSPLAGSAHDAAHKDNCDTTLTNRLADASSLESTACDFRAQYNVEESALWFRPRSGGGLIQASGFHLRDSAAALVGVEDLKLGTLDARMRLHNERFNGPLRILDSHVQLRGGKPVNLSLLAQGWSEDDGSAARFSIQAMQLGNSESELEVNDSLVNWSQQSGLMLRVPDVRVDDITAIVGHMLSPEIPTALWIKRLGMTGRFTRLLASWSSEAGLGFGGDFDSVAMRNFRGVPKVDHLAGSFTGGPGYLQLRMLDSTATVGFPQLYRDEQFYNSLSGEILLYFGQDYFGMEGSNLRFKDSVATTSGSFSLVSTKPLTNNHITLALESDAGEFADLSPYVPYKLPQNILDWLAESGLEAKLEAPRFVMHGPLREEESQMGRSYLIDAEMHQGAMVFNPEWPRITNAEGRVRVAHSSISADLAKATLAGMALENMQIRLPSGTASVQATGTAVFDASAGLEFIRSTPLKSSMDFVADDWWAEGQMRLAIDLDLPLETETSGELDPRVSVEISGQLQDTTFGLPEAGLTFTGLRGPLRYTYPYELTGKNIAGNLFNRSMTLDMDTQTIGDAPPGKPARFAPRRIDFSMQGAMHSDDMWPLLSMEPSKIVDGVFDFDAVYSTETNSDSAPTLSAKTNLAGTTVTLPAPLGKAAAELSPTEISVEFGNTQTRANLSYQGMLSAELGIEAGGIVGGHLRLVDATTGSDSSGQLITTQEPARFAQWNNSRGAVLIDGALSSADVAEWAAGSEEGVDLPPYRIVDLKIRRALLGDFEIPSVVVSGESDESLLSLRFESETAAGELVAPEEGMTELNLARFIYTDQDSGSATDALNDLDEDEIMASLFAESGEPKDSLIEPDPLTPEMMASLQDMDVQIESLVIDGEDYGNWSFEIRTTPAGVAFSSLEASLKGITVVSEEGAQWDRIENRTSISTKLTAEDMGDVLEQWGYARSIETESMLTYASVSWPGSPLNFELLQLQGDIAAGIKTGRFLDVTSGNNALRIFSLLNFTAIAKRMSLNFKDVFGRGVSFEKVEATTRLDEGLIRFTKPMRVEGTGGDFKVNGSIDLNAGVLDNEMVVTLPVNKSLPWLGAYLALANPVVGIGVLVGERILRKPIKELSSAKYRVTGPADDPQLELVSVFDRSMDDGDSDGNEIEVPDDLPPLEELIEEAPETLQTLDSDSESEVDGSITPSAAESATVGEVTHSTNTQQDADQFNKESVPDGSIATSPGT